MAPAPEEGAYPIAVTRGATSKEADERDAYSAFLEVRALNREAPKKNQERLHKGGSCLIGGMLLGAARIV